MSVDHCESFENWCPEFGNMYSMSDLTNYSPDGSSEMLGLNPDPTARFWCPPIQNPYYATCDDRLKMHNCVYEEMSYSSSPSSINSQNISEYSTFSFEQESSPRKSAYINNSQNHPEDYSSIIYQDPVSIIGNHPPVKRRCTANRKERRRTEALNTAFSDLRNCIPNIPKDTKLSKIKTLKHAISHITLLMKTLQAKDANTAYNEFTADIISRDSNSNKRRGSYAVQFIPSKSDKISESNYEQENSKKRRTGWPQHVWALELQQKQL